ncbi:hypothetical protein RJT34_04070 [Clitoria ternatea]|uniref:Potassium channel domain-containing protein n=1 Tax=Clitoria ternatea TaxID=43366 RepID=A0AAN9KKK9_CLITE
MGIDEAQQSLLSESRHHSQSHVNDKSDLQRRRPGYATSASQKDDSFQQQNVVRNPFNSQSIVTKPEAGFHFRVVLWWLGSYLGVGTICFLLISQQINGIKTNGFLDALYFCVVTMTTVRYGDLVPNSPLAKILACIYVFSGTTLVGFILSKGANYIVEKQEIFVVKAVLKRERFGSELPQTNKAKYKLMVAVTTFLVLMVTGTIFLYFVENLDFVDALYCVCSTVTTLGYGDKSFSTTIGRTFAVFWILSSTVCLAQFFGYLAEFYTEESQRLLAKMVLTRKLSLLDLEAADLDGDRVVRCSHLYYELLHSSYRGFLISIGMMCGSITAHCTESMAILKNLLLVSGMS